jgi:hypothetical protein
LFVYAVPLGARNDTFALVEEVKLASFRGLVASLALVWALTNTGEAHWVAVSASVIGLVVVSA